ncbi:hypothetical protein [Paraburkholderia tropica]|uniref:hypothetical protein n=1 Tax=Paraburkholderia tropica TaxID=92647 RepID=UPI002AB76AEC|nr:hypothetical protein [Paraburkholderia tropica]
MISFWILVFLVSSILFYVHCLDWSFLVRHRQLLGYFVHTPTYFVGDLASMLAYIALLVLGARQLLGFAHNDGLYVIAALFVTLVVGHRRANAALRAGVEDVQ